MGLYIASIRLSYPESVYFDDLYFYAREGRVFDAESMGFDVQTFMSILCTLISIPIVCGQFSKNYVSKRCYITSRFKNYSLFYFNEVINIFAFCFLTAVFYSLGICAVCAVKSNFLLSNNFFILLYLISVLNSALLLAAFCLVIIPFCVQNEKAAVLSGIILFAALAVITFYLPAKYKYFDIIMIYFVNTLFQNNKYVSFNCVVCYAVTFFVIAASVLFGTIYLKKKDTK